MAQRFVNIDRDTPMLLPPDMRDWLPADHLVHFLVDALESVPDAEAKVNARGTGSAQFPPLMLLGLLIYGYITGRFSSREIERATHSDVAMRYMAGGHHPDHDTICTFRRVNAPFIKSSFTAVLLLAKELKLLKVGTVSVDGTKVLANASKHKAVSYKRAGEQIVLIEQEVDELLARAADADSKDLADGLSIPTEIARREERREKLLEARRIIEEQAREAAALEEPLYQEKLAERERRQVESKRVGPAPKPPSDIPDPKAQFNFTDPQSAIMKAGSGKHFEQSYNAQSAVDADGSMLVIGVNVSDQANDKEQLHPSVASIDPEVGTPKAVVCDSGFYSQKQVKLVEANGVTTVYAATAKQHHHRTIADLEPHQEPATPGPDATPAEHMAHRLKTAAGKALYKLRKETVEPVFGIVKEVMGFRRFLMRGIENVNNEWVLVNLAYNCKRIFKLKSQQTV